MGFQCFTTSLFILGVGGHSQYLWPSQALSCFVSGTPVVSALDNIIHFHGYYLVQTSGGHWCWNH